VAVVIHINAYNQMIFNAIQHYGKNYVDQYADFHPIWVWRYGEIYPVTAIFLIIGWAYTIFQVVKAKRKGCAKAKLISLLSTLLIITFINANMGYAPTKATTENYFFCIPNSVDLLFVADEELLADTEIVGGGGFFGWYRLENWETTRVIEEIIFPSLQDRFLNEVGISIAFNGWLEWDSNDTETWTDYLLIEAMNETGWDADNTYRHREFTTTDAYGRDVTFVDDKRRMDILVVVTLQQMDMIGFAMTKEAADDYSDWLGKPVEYNAVIVAYQEQHGEDMVEILQHEISHIFELKHCGNINCVMNPDAWWMGSVTWCTHCAEILNAWWQGSVTWCTHCAEILKTKRDMFPPE